jgi:hypothetical protein
MLPPWAIAATGEENAMAEPTLFEVFTDYV